MGNEFLYNDAFTKTLSGLNQILLLNFLNPFLKDQILFDQHKAGISTALNPFLLQEHSAEIKQLIRTEVQNPKIPYPLPQIFKALRNETITTPQTVDALIQKPIDKELLLKKSGYDQLCERANREVGQQFITKITNMTQTQALASLEDGDLKIEFNLNDNQERKKIITEFIEAFYAYAEPVALYNELCNINDAAMAEWNQKNRENLKRYNEKLDQEKKENHQVLEWAEANLKHFCLLKKIAENHEEYQAYLYLLGIVPYQSQTVQTLEQALCTTTFKKPAQKSNKPVNTTGKSAAMLELKPTSIDELLQMMIPAWAIETAYYHHDLELENGYPTDQPINREIRDTIRFFLALATAGLLLATFFTVLPIIPIQEYGHLNALYQLIFKHDFGFKAVYGLSVCFIISVDMLVALVCLGTIQMINKCFDHYHENTLKPYFEAKLVHYTNENCKAMDNTLSGAPIRTLLTYREAQLITQTQDNAPKHNNNASFLSNTMTIIN